MSEIYFYKNEMLNYIDEEVYRYGICKDYERTKDMLNGYYIKEVEGVKRIKIEEGDRTIIKSFIKRYMKKYTIYEREISTCVISEEELEKRIEEIKEIIKDRERVKEYKNKDKKKEIENKNKRGKLKKIEEKELRKYTKTLTRGEGELQIYRYTEMNYYGEGVWLYEIMPISKKGREKDNTVYYVAEITEDNYKSYGKSIGIDKRLISIIMYMNLKGKKGYYKEERKIIYGIIDNEKILKDIEELGKGWKDINIKDKEIIKGIVKKIEDYYEMEEGEIKWFEDYMVSLIK